MPGSVVAAVLLLAAMTPGFAFHQAYRRFSAKGSRTSVTEVVELFSVGALATCLGALVSALLAEWIPYLVSLKDVATAPADAAERPWSWVVSGILTMTLSMAASIWAGRYVGKRSPQRRGERLREGTVTSWVLTEHDADGRWPFLAVELSDGRLVEGYLRHVSHDEDPARRDIVLQRPVLWTGPGDIPRTLSSARMVVVPGSLIRVIHLRYPHTEPPSPST
ncbi:DUF6338 family protein [Streptomyces sp. NPDC060035]|uniref:DUF6338 family protein n=1 Tax=Streptomyces sp. NPDC060035 TaxID=3347044 RepID=UPI00369D3408